MVDFALGLRARRVAAECRSALASLAMSEHTEREPGDGGGRSPVVARPASTVMIVRDGPDGESPLEVLMLRRTLRADFVGGAHVFPGGAVDPADASAEVADVCRGLDDAAASATLGVGSGGLAYWVAAVRECFEEAALLYARTAQGTLVGDADRALAARLEAHRAALNAHGTTLAAVCEAEGLTLALDHLSYFAHWITPEGSPRRYDTRFFVAAAPPGQVPAHDAGETIADVWVRPADALEHHRAGRMDLILPTIRNLQAIGRFSTTAELLAAARTLTEVPAMLPRLVADGGGVRLLLPGDPGYDDPDHPGAGPLGAPSALAAHFDAAAREASRRALGEEPG